MTVRVLSEAEIRDGYRRLASKQMNKRKAALFRAQVTATMKAHDRRRDILARQIAADINWLEARRDTTKQIRALQAGNRALDQQNSELRFTNTEIIRQVQDLERRFAERVARDAKQLDKACANCRHHQDYGCTNVRLTAFNPPLDWFCKDWEAKP